MNNNRRDNIAHRITPSLAAKRSGGGLGWGSRQKNAHHRDNVPSITYTYTIFATLYLNRRKTP